MQYHMRVTSGHEHRSKHRKRLAYVRRPKENPPSDTSEKVAPHDVKLSMIGLMDMLYARRSACTAMTY
jgi:hypothetical protein